MAVNSPLFRDGQSELIQSSGTTVTPRFLDGLSYVVHEYVAAEGAVVKTINGLALASVKTYNGLAIGSVKTINGAATQ